MENVNLITGYRIEPVINIQSTPYPYASNCVISDIRSNNYRLNGKLKTNHFRDFPLSPKEPYQRLGDKPRKIPLEQKISQRYFREVIKYN